MRSKFTSAFDQGKAVAMQEVINYTNPEDFIFVAMQDNPFKGEKSRKDFIEGVSFWVNKAACLRNRRMNGGE